MKSRTQILILCLLYVGCASVVLSKEIKFAAKFSEARNIKDPWRPDTPMQETNDARTDEQSAYKLRDKRALGLLLSGLAQIFGYTVTPIQIASLPNPTNVTRAVATSNTSAMSNIIGQTASSRPTSINVTAPRQQETLRFTGVVNFGNNSDIIGHLQRYEQIFHGRSNNTMMTTIPRPMPMPISPAVVSVDPKTNSATRPPLLAPFFVKIPLPIAPDLPPATIPIESFKLSYPAPSVSFASESNETAKAPVRKKQEMIYENKKNIEQYTVEEKDIYNEKDVTKPANRYNHKLYIDEPSTQQNDKQQREQKERVERPKEQEEERNLDRDTHQRKNEIDERHREREEEIADRNQEHASKDHESTEEKKSTYDDEDEEDEDSEEHVNQTNESSKQPPRKNESKEVEDDNDESEEQFDGYKQPENFNKYVNVGYDRQLPIGDYFHNPEVIRDSYGEILDDKKLEDDRIASYISMFRHHPYTGVFDSQGARDPEDDEKKSSAVDAYEEHLVRLQKLREEYAQPGSRYEEYDLNNENEASRDDRDNGRTQNRTSTRAKERGPKKERVPDKEDSRAKIATGPSKNKILQDNAAKLENAKSQEEIDFARYMPLIVPIRYVDNDKTQQATTRQLSYEESAKSPAISGRGRFSEDSVSSAQERLSPQIGLPERPRKLHTESEHKEYQIWPPPFDYAFDNTAPANTVISPNAQNYYPPNYYQHVKNIAANDANNDNPSERPSGYLVVVGNSAQPYQYPYNIYYFPSENAHPQNQVSHSNVENTYSRDQVYVPRHNTNQHFVNLTEYYLNETARDRYRQPHVVPTNVLDHHRYIFNERAQPLYAKESVNIQTRDRIPNEEKWPGRIHQLRSQSDSAERPPPVFVQLQNVASSNQNVQTRPQYSRPLEQKSSRLENLRLENQRVDDERVKIPQPILANKPFDDPRSAHDFFGFSQDDYSFADESSDASKAAERNGSVAKESDMPIEPIVYHRDNESVGKHAGEPENNPERAKVTEYRNKVATLRISEQRQSKPNGPIHYVDIIRDI